MASFSGLSSLQRLRRLVSRSDSDLLYRDQISGSSLFPYNQSYDKTINNEEESISGDRRKTRRRIDRWIFGSVLDPRSQFVVWCNRCFLVARGLSLFIDPMFFHVMVVAAGGCMTFDRPYWTALAVLRTCIDALHLVYIWMKLRLAFVARQSLVVGSGVLVWDAKAIAGNYLRSGSFLFDIFVIIPLPQIYFGLLVPNLNFLQAERILEITSTLFVGFLFQFLPKLYHVIYLMRSMKRVTGYIFGTIWGGFALNVVAYFLSSHVTGGCWYILAIQRLFNCVKEQCAEEDSCNLMTQVCAAGNDFLHKINGTSIGENYYGVCFKSKATAAYYGIYLEALPLISSNILSAKILYPLYWGHSTLSTFGNNLQPTSQWLEVIFSIATVFGGLMLFTHLIGNIQEIFHSMMCRKKTMQGRFREVDWWMKRRQIPSRLKRRIWRYEQQKWSTMRGQSEMEIIKDLPHGLRRAIKRHLCLDLIKQVPLFHDLTDLVLDNICERANHIMFTKGEKLIRYGDSIQQMFFIMTGQVKSIQPFRKGVIVMSMLGPKSFLGDELIGWCLQRPFIDQLPRSTATFQCTEATEIFALDVHDLCFVIDHFRCNFTKDKMRIKARYYSTIWRTWAALQIQLAWDNYKARNKVIELKKSKVDDRERRLRLYATGFVLFRPREHLD